MDKSRLEPCFMRLIQSLKMNQTKQYGITVFIGAGCSLSSSDKDITTYGIVKKLVKQFSLDGQAPDDWRDLYKIFVNTVWNGQGSKNRIQLLEDFFQDMHPSAGYQVLRWLLENKYINHIITTNFDPMIDTVLDGLSYHLIVGEYTEIIGDDPQFTLIKAHGDLRIGQLRFAPAELSKLPERLTNRIQTITKCVVIVVGYRGQDLGILNALYDTDEYHAFWISIHEPDRSDAYDYQQVRTWMHKRNSEENFLYGEEFGEFDRLFKKIKHTITVLKENEIKDKSDIISEQWRKSIIFEYFYLNKRFLKLYEKLNKYLNQQISGKRWKSTSPYYAVSYEKIVKSVLDLFNGNTIPSSYYCIGNEVDALVFATSCSIWLVCQGYPYTANDLLNDMRQRFEAEEAGIIISSEFWDILDVLSSPNQYNERKMWGLNTPISFCFDSERDFSTVLKHIDLWSFQELFHIIEVLLLFVQTSGGTGEELYRLQNKRVLEKYLYEIQNRDGAIMLQMSSMPLNVYNDLYETILKPYFIVNKTGERYTLYCSPIYVDITIEQTKLNRYINIWESLIQEGEMHYQNFVSDFDITQYIDRSCIKVFSDFLDSQSSGLFIIGESGCGKTSALKLWLAELPSEQFIVYAVNGRDQDGKLELGEKVFGEMFMKPKNLGYLQVMLEQRQQTLLLVLDSINEIQGSFIYIMSNYKALLNFCNSLASNGFLNIRLVITCRSDFYYQLKKGCGIIPSSSSFFSFVINNDELSTTYTIPYFDNQNVEAFADLYHFQKPQIVMDELKKEYGDLIYLPINLRMICDAYHISGNPESSSEKDVIFETWYNSLQNLAEKDGILRKTIISVVEFTINYNYFSKHEEGLKTHVLAASLASKCSDALAVYEWLVSHGVYKKNTYIPNLIQFSHDKLEENFLTNYILTYYSSKLYDLDDVLSTEYCSLSVLEKALINVFVRTSVSDKLIYLNSIINIIRKKNLWLQTIAINALFQIINTDTLRGYTILKETEQYLLQKDFCGFIKALLQTFKQELDVMGNASLEIIEVINQIIETTNTQYDPNLHAAGLYLFAKGKFLLPSENDTDKYKQALERCKQAEEHITPDTPDNLVNSINILKAMLLQNQGQLNEAIELMETCYKKQKKSGLYDAACQSALSLGAMYREMTRFDDAINLYDSIDTQRVKDETAVNRLYMNKGIIYKNKVQNAMFLNNLDMERDIGFYQTALKYFTRTCSFAEEKDDVPLRLEIYAELVECMCLAYYLNMGTISDAVHWVEEMDKIIGRYSVPVERIQHMRMWARVLVLQCKLEEAIQYLEMAFSIAVSYNIRFRATDCCNLITGIITDNLNNITFITDDILQKGLTYGEYAINYYKELKNTHHQYLQDSIVKYNNIKEAWLKNHPSN